MSPARHLIIWLFHLLVMVTPFAFTSLTDELFEFNKMLVVYALTLLIAAAWLWRIVQEKRVLWQPTFLVIPLVLYFLSQLLSTIFSIDIHTSIYGYYSRFHGGLLSTLAYLTLFFAATSNLRKADLRPLITTALLAAVGVSLYALPEHFGVSPSCVLITGEYTVSCWVQDVQTRIFGTFGQPNWLAAYLLMMIPLAWWYWYSAWEKSAQTSWDRLQRWWPPLGLFLYTLTLLYTRSRSGFLALGISLAIIAGGALLLLLRQPKTGEKTRPAFPLFLSSAVGVVVGSGLLFLLAGTPYSAPLSEYLKRQNSVTAPPVALESPPTPEESPVPQTPAETPSGGTVLENGGTDSGKIRFIVWKGALAVWKRYPLFGSGLETFAYSYYLDRPAEHNLVSEWDFLYNRAHNEFLNILATSGTVGLVTTILLMGWFVVDVLRATFLVQKTPETTRVLGIALLSGYAALAFSNFFGFSTVMVGVLFFLYKAWWVIDQASEDEIASELVVLQPEKKSSRILRARQTDQHTEFEINPDTSWLGYAAIVVLTLIGLSQVWMMWQNDLLFARAKAAAATGDAYSAYVMGEELVRRAPDEPVFSDEYSLLLARLAAGTAVSDEPEASASARQLSEQAVAFSDRTIALNPVHLNFWKTRARVFMFLATYDTSYYGEAVRALEKGLELSPNDPKLYYNLALVYQELGDHERAGLAYTNAILLKPNYEQARTAYGEWLEAQGNLVEAAAQYRYVLENISATAPTATERLQGLPATVSGSLSP